MPIKIVPAPFHVFIVEDDPIYSELMEYYLQLNPDYRVSKFSTASDCIRNLELKPDLITIDYSLPDMTGEKLLEYLQVRMPDTPVIIISAQEDVKVALSLLKKGVCDYLVKDSNTCDLLWNAILKIRQTQYLKNEVHQLRAELGVKYDFEKVIKGNSTAIKRIFGLIEKASGSAINVSISGETGTGKELIAKAIHYNSGRSNYPFVPVNMAAIPSELVESELFGFEKGAFTGAISRRIGKFEEANGGTLFLDEISELSIALQSKLLRVLQERELHRLGGSDSIALDVRLIVASNKNLQEEVRQGRFREDLYYRIMGLPIHLPPLRDRGNDILVLAKHFADAFCIENKLSPVVLTESACEKLLQYAYPGNIRELKAIIELAVVLCDSHAVVAQDILLGSSEGNAFLYAENKTLKDYTTEIIQHYMYQYEGNVAKVASVLDLGKSTIYKMIQQKEIVL